MIGCDLPMLAFLDEVHEISALLDALGLGSVHLKLAWDDGQTCEGPWLDDYWSDMDGVCTV